MTKTQNDFDPFAPWKQLQDTSMKAWATMMSDIVANEAFAQTMGMYLDNYLENAAPIQQQVEKGMEKYLAQINMPSRNELTTLAERLTHLEMRTDDIEAKVDEVLDHLKAIRELLAKSTGKKH